MGVQAQAKWAPQSEVVRTGLLPSAGCRLRPNLLRHHAGHLPSRLGCDSCQLRNAHAPMGLCGRLLAGRP
eukprot:1141750-Pleurochrysis_carterae.AAC.1